MPKLMIVWVIPFILLCSCNREGSSNTKKVEKLQNVANAVEAIDTSVQDRNLDTAKLDMVSYKGFVEDPLNGYIKTRRGNGFDLDVMYRPITYEALMAVSDLSRKEIEKNQQIKSQVLSFTVKRTAKTPSVLAKADGFKAYLLDDSTGGHLEPVYFMSDHKLGTTEVFYCVFDRAAATQMHGDILHLVWEEQGRPYDIYYTQRILRQDFIHIHDVN